MIIIGEGGSTCKVFQGIAPFQSIAALRSLALPLLSFEQCGIILFGKRGWPVKKIQGVRPFLAVAALGSHILLVFSMALWIGITWVEGLSWKYL